MPEHASAHLPVLPDETLAALAPRDGGRYLDGTVGLGGHAERLLDASAPAGTLIGLDRDPQALAIARDRLARFGARVTLVQASYTQAPAVAREHGALPLDGLLLDLGVSSLQLNRPDRGFSFQHNGPLDMRFDPSSSEPTAAEFLNTASEAEIADAIWRYGEERASRRVARAIVRARPIATTTELTKIVEGAVPGPRGKTSPATRTFQGLRIAVNGELDALRAVLEDAATLLRAGGRLAVITFHSLEDRIVKQFLQRESRDCLCPPAAMVCGCGHTRTFRPLARGSVTASADEVRRNPRARSARLRAAERV